LVVFPPHFNTVWCLGIVQNYAIYGRWVTLVVFPVNLNTVWCRGTVQNNAHCGRLVTLVIFPLGSTLSDGWELFKIMPLMVDALLWLFFP
jgi:hypothetical protein